MKTIDGHAMIERVRALYEKGAVDLSYFNIVREAVQMEPEVPTVPKEKSVAGALRPCPFCGREARAFQIPQNTPEECGRHPDWRWKNPGMWVVGCDTSLCFGNVNNATMTFYDERAAARIWNRRG